MNVARLFRLIAPPPVNANVSVPDPPVRLSPALRVALVALTVLVAPEKLTVSLPVPRVTVLPLPPDTVRA